jgi:thiamine biosynthesis lipoprotein ApbE
MEADALATAFCAAGFDKGVALARGLNVSALFVTDTDEVMTGTFSQHVLV